MEGLFQSDSISSDPHVKMFDFVAEINMFTYSVAFDWQEVQTMAI